VAALAIAAHELGHASRITRAISLFDCEQLGTGCEYRFLPGMDLDHDRDRSTATAAGLVGCRGFLSGSLFALATLPVELNASARAKRLLRDSGLIRAGEEERGVNNVLNAAALTYVAALITAVLQLLYWVMLVLGMGRRR
jgi:uncharacterized protein